MCGVIQQTFHAFAIQPNSKWIEQRSIYSISFSTKATTKKTKLSTFAGFAICFFLPRNRSNTHEEPFESYTMTVQWVIFSGTTLLFRLWLPLLPLPLPPPSLPPPPPLLLLLLLLMLLLSLMLSLCFQIFSANIEWYTSLYSDYFM